MKFIRIASVVTLSALLVACGGGDCTPAQQPAQQPTQPAQVAPLPVFLVMGQSNAVGSHTHYIELPADLKEVQPNTLMFDGAKWPPMIPSDPFGPEVGFGTRMSRNGQIGIIKYAVSSTNLANDWSPTRAGSLYFKALDTIQAAKATRPIKIAGVLWVQGESDTLYADMGKGYGANLTAFIQALRHDLGDQSIPFVAARINLLQSKDYPYLADVRAGIEEVPLPGYAWIDCDDLPQDIDHMHFTSAGELTLGGRFSDAITKLLAFNPR